ncbi:hypothetical protein I7I48_02171 [Histoplasma ohiense]|nr:hypothetical protein I7I48_02171 [Histoplasma ohiense (nom. inval.)]
MHWFVVVIIIVLLLLLAYVAWIAFTHLRARRSGLPPPPLKSYIPFSSAFNSSSSSSSQYLRDSSYPTPRAGGIGDWFKDKWNAVRNRRTARGAYESPLDSGAGAGGHRGFGSGGAGGAGGGAYAHDEIWDSRIGEGGYGGAGAGYYEEQEELGLTRHVDGSGPYELGGRMEAGTVPKAGPTASTVTVDLHGGESEPGPAEAERGRSRSREPAYGSQTDGATLRENPFTDQAEPTSLRDASPRPEVGGPTTKITTTTTGADTAESTRGRSPDRKSGFIERL